MSGKGNRKTEAFVLTVGCQLIGNKGVYIVQEFLGEGGFGNVAKCSKLWSLEYYAVKIMKTSSEGQKEFETMKLIQDLDPDENHLIKMYECFTYRNMTCIVYELLEVNFHDSLMNEEQLVPLCYIRGIAQQLFKALKALKSIGVAHCDIKLDNIMFADLDVMDVKLIDFGLAVETNELLTGTKLQVTQFRAPEVILGLPLDESIDMWALGMVLACVYCGYYLFPSSTEYETIRAMVQIFGLPEADVLHRANYKDAFFTRDNGDWRLCTPEEYTELTGNRVRYMNPVIDFDAMTDKHRNMYEMHDDDDHRAFIDLLKRILEVNPQRRITPSQALEHDFITMKHLAGESKAAYAAGCKGVMGKTPSSEAQVTPSASSSSSMSGSSNQSLKSSMSDGEIVDVREVPSAESADEQSSLSSLNSSDSCEKPVFQENLEKTEDLQTDKDKAKMSRNGNRKTEAFELMEGHYLVGNQGIYQVQEFLGEGGFGKVAKCTKLGSPEKYAIKIITNVQEGKEEFESMKLIQDLDPDENHLMKMYECFSFQNVICLVYEILEESLEDFLIKNECKATPLTCVRALAQQMLQALKALKSIGVAHCDIKLDNIMFADKKSLKFKLIDFGLAVETKELQIGTEIQVIRFRAPEVILGLPLDESIDMWALGMVLACVYFGNYPFPSRTEYETIRAMVQIFGLPEADVLHRANYKDAFFTRDNGDWRLCTPEEYTKSTGEELRKKNHVIDFDAMTEKHRNMYEMHNDDDHKAFIDLLKRILEVNPQRRITPSQALEHDFITMKHLAGKSKAVYAAGCKGVMGKTPPSEAQVNSSASSSSSMSGSSNQSLKSSMSDGEIVDVREVPSAESADEQSSLSSLNSSDSCEKPVFQENLEKTEDLQTDKDKAKMSRNGNRKTEAFKLMEGHYLVGNQGIYQVQEFLGEGSFGKVAKCTKLGSPEMYAIKIIANVQEGKEEFESMKLIQDLDPDENHLMKMYECFSFQNGICLVYEILCYQDEDVMGDTQLGKKKKHLSSDKHGS